VTSSELNYAIETMKVMLPGGKIVAQEEWEDTLFKEGSGDGIIDLTRESEDSVIDLVSSEEE
jgi:hypothetical protein